MAARHRSAGGRWWSWRSWSIQRLRGRPELRTQSRSGRLPSDVSTCSRNHAWWAGMLGGILATWPKMASRRLLMLSITGRRPVCAATSSLRTWSCQRMRRICRWHFMWEGRIIMTAAQYTVWVKKLVIPPWSFQNGWEFLSKILRGYCMFMATTNYKILLNYL